MTSPAPGCSPHCTSPACTTSPSRCRRRTCRSATSRRRTAPASRWSSEASMSELLPRNRTVLERRLARAQQRLGELPVEIRHLRNPITCPALLLPYLAWELSVDEWNPAWDEDVKRRVIAESMRVHRRKGTRGAM